MTRTPTTSMAGWLVRLLVTGLLIGGSVVVVRAARSESSGSVSVRADAPVGARSVALATLGPSESHPLSDVLGFGFDIAAEEAAFRKDELARQNFVAACMAEAGFDYVPNATGTPPVDVSPPSGSDSLLGLTDDLAEPTSARELRASSLQEIANKLAADAADINGQYYDSLSPEEKIRYQVALNGSDPRTIAADDPQATTLARFATGCSGRSYEEITPYHDGTQELYVEYENRTRAAYLSPEVRSAERTWSECMATLGFDFDNRREVALRLLADTETARRLVAEQQQQWVDTAMRRLKDGESPGDTADGLVLSDSVVDALEATRPAAWPQAVRIEVEKATALEASLTAADRSCADGYDQAVGTVLLRVAEDFAADYSSQLATIRERQQRVYGG